MKRGMSRGGAGRGAGRGMGSASAAPAPSVNVGGSSFTDGGVNTALVGRGLPAAPPASGSAASPSSEFYDDLDGSSTLIKLYAKKDDEIAGVALGPVKFRPNSAADKKRIMDKIAAIGAAK